jgi:hypothetical protein
MSLRNWLASGWIVEPEPTPEEISDLLAAVDRDLQDAALESLSPDWKLGIAYNGALQLAMLVLAAEDSVRREYARMSGRFSRFASRSLSTAQP